MNAQAQAVAEMQRWYDHYRAISAERRTPAEREILRERLYRFVDDLIDAAAADEAELDANLFEQLLTEIERI